MYPKNGIIPKDSLPGEEFSASEKLESEEVIKSIISGKHIVGVGVYSSVVVDDLIAHKVSNHGHFAVGTVGVQA